MPEFDHQCSLPFELDERELGRRLTLLTGKAVSLSITSNRVSVLSVRNFLSGGRDGIRLRLHCIFLKAGPEVIREVARFITSGKKGARFPLITRFIKENEAELKNKKDGRTRELRLNVQGRFHDLGRIYDSLNAEYFGGGIECAITWGKRPQAGTVRKRTLGSFSCDGMGPGKGLIRINPVLDRKNVPSYYVRFVVYHEMLHADMGVGRKNGRRQVHTPLFKERERLFGDFERATAYEKSAKRPG